MQRDVKVGLVLGVLLVAVVAVVFFRRDHDDRDKFVNLLPAPDAVAERARNMLGPASSDPYPVGNEYLVDSWQSPKPKSVRTPTPPRNTSADLTAEIDPIERPVNERGRSNNSAVAVLEQPEFDPPKPGTRPKASAVGIRPRSSNADGTVRSGNVVEYTIQEGDTLSDIARRYLGSAGLWEQLFEENKEVLSDPGNIPLGKKIRITTNSRPERTGTDRVAAAASTAHGSSTVVPPRSARTNTAGDSARNSTEPGGSYVVREGDSLIRIAREVYHRDAMYVEILRANQDQIDPAGTIQPGMVLRLP